MTATDERLDAGRPRTSRAGLAAWGIVAAASVTLLIWQWLIDPDPGLRDLQLSWGAEAALRVLRAWERTDQLSTANRSITIDWFFIPAYLVAIGGMCLWGRRSINWDLWRALGRFAAALVAVAALLDVVENVEMRRMISTGDADPAVLVSAVSSAKLVLVVLGLLYGLTAAANRTAGAAEEVIGRFEHQTRGAAPGLSTKQVVMGATSPQESAGAKDRPPRFPPHIAVLR